MAIVKSANAEWHGNLKDGTGKVMTESGALDSAYGFNTRFGDQKGTNPEELIGAAHAGCFTMAFSNELFKAGFTAESIKTEDKVHLEKVGEGFEVTKIEVTMQATVPGIDDENFQKIAEHAKVNCPISKALKAVNITLTATLNK